MGERPGLYEAVRRVGGGAVRVQGGPVPWVIAGGIGLLCLVWVGNLGVEGAPWSLLWGALLWLYLCSVVFFGISVVARFFGVAPKLPFIPADYCGRPWVTAALALVVVLVTALREGVAAPQFVLQLNWWEATHAVRHDLTSTFSSTALDGSEVAFRNRPLFCSMRCRGDDVGCEVVDELITCDDRPPRPDAVNVDLTVNLPDVECFVPLAKQLQGQYRAAVDLQASTAGASKHGHLSVDGNVELEMTGLASCYAFRRKVGELVGRDLVGVIDQHITQN